MKKKKDGGGIESQGWGLREKHSEEKTQRNKSCENLGEK